MIKIDNEANKKIPWAKILKSQENSTQIEILYKPYMKTKAQNIDKHVYVCMSIYTGLPQIVHKSWAENKVLP